MDTFTLKITSTLNEESNNESWGVRDVQLFAEDIVETTPTKPAN